MNDKEIVQSRVKTFLLSVENYSQNVLLLPQNCTMAQYFIQPFPKPGSNVFKLHCRGKERGKEGGESLPISKGTSELEPVGRWERGTTH